MCWLQIMVEDKHSPYDRTRQTVEVLKECVMDQQMEVAGTLDLLQ